jgi:hypothetical protein
MPGKCLISRSLGRRLHRPLCQFAGPAWQMAREADETLADKLFTTADVFPYHVRPRRSELLFTTAQVT